ncbi:MAG: S10 family peptidase [Planctomycetota bacterium]
MTTTHRSTLLCMLLLALLAWLPAAGSIAQDHREPRDPGESGESGDGAATDNPAIADADHVVTAVHTIKVGDKPITYRVTTGTMVLNDEAGKPRASFFCVSYVVETPDTDPATRPVTFTFNGGPGSASVWLHLGAFGPRRVSMGAEGFDSTPPARLSDNASTLLDVTDLVFIDPVSTGYSRAADDQKAGQFHGLEEDISSVGEFIHLWTNRNQRWASPKFLAGESYGTTRAAGLSDHLQQRYGMYLNGVILISSILNFGTARFDEGNDLPYPLFLPTYTATAWFHKRLADDLQSHPLKDVLAAAEDFARRDYTLALMAGDDLGEEQQARVAGQLARFTGTTTRFALDNNLRIRMGRFNKELRRDAGLTVGRLDSRFTGIDRDNAGDGPEYDPSMAAIMGPYSTAFNSYVRDELGFRSDLPYEILTGRVHPWSYRRYENRYVNVAPRLRNAIVQNPALKVFVANGYYDLATPYFATHYTFSHLGLPASLRGNITMRHYEAGHMMYIREADLAGLHNDVAAFIRSSAPSSGKRDD